MTCPHPCCSPEAKHPPKATDCIYCSVTTHGTCARHKADISRNLDGDYPSHTDALMETGEGYTIEKGWTVACLWCAWFVTRPTKRAAVAEYEAHERAALHEEASRGCPACLRHEPHPMTAMCGEASE